MKHMRHAKILELIEKHAIETQEELADKLKECGFETTQATVSRDIKELRLIKVGLADDHYKYAVNGGNEKPHAGRMQGVFTQGTTHIELAMNLVVIKTLTGMAQAVAAAVDDLGWQEIVGTIAGDDTIMIATKGEQIAQALAQKLRKFL